LPTLTLLLTLTYSDTLTLYFLHSLTLPTLPYSFTPSFLLCLLSYYFIRSLPLTLLTHIHAHTHTHTHTHTLSLSLFSLYLMVKLSQRHKSGSSHTSCSIFQYCTTSPPLFLVTRFVSFFTRGLWFFTYIYALLLLLEFERFHNFYSLSRLSYLMSLESFKSTSLESFKSTFSLMSHVSVFSFFLHLLLW